MRCDSLTNPGYRKADAENADSEARKVAQPQSVNESNPGRSREAAVNDSSETRKEEKRKLRIIATSDLHGKFFPWDYVLNAASPSGSMAQLAVAVKQYRTEDTILVDAGDTIQDNSADLFVYDEGVHPMVQGMNIIGYDVCVMGNHDFNYGMDVVKKLIRDYACITLTGNVYDEAGEPIADGWTILEKNGIRVAVIGMVSPNIVRWDAANLANCTVTDPLEEIRKIIKKIQGQYDVLIGVFHMGLENELGTPNSGVTDILNACPEFDLMVSAHDHNLIEGTEINGVLTVQNKNQAQTMTVIDLTLERKGENWEVTDRSSQTVMINTFEADPEIMEMLQEYHEKGIEDAKQVIGRLEGMALAPETKCGELPAALLQDTPLIDLINNVQMHYARTVVSAAQLCWKDSNLAPGVIHKSDSSILYPFQNTLYRVRMTGAQLKKFMEWSAGWFKTVKPGAKSLSTRDRFKVYNYLMFAGVRYVINLSREPGSRIEYLTWMDGTPVKDEDTFSIAVDSYCANSYLLTRGEVYDKDVLPVLEERDVCGKIGGVRELIRDYIVNVKDGVIHPECDENWRFTGLE